MHIYVVTYIYQTHVHAVYSDNSLHADIVMEYMGIVCMKLYSWGWGHAGKIQVSR